MFGTRERRQYGFKGPKEGAEPIPPELIPSFNELLSPSKPRILVNSIEAENPLMTSQEAEELKLAASSINYFAPPMIPGSVREVGRRVLSK